MTKQEENQIMAALAFWRAVAMTSRVHPSEHPACEPFFEEHRPLSIEDVERLMAGPLSSDLEDGLTTLAHACKNTKITPTRLRYRLKRAGIQPCSEDKRFWPVDAVRTAMRELRAKEEMFMRRYNLDEVEDPTS